MLLMLLYATFTICHYLINGMGINHFFKSIPFSKEGSLDLK